MKNGYETLLQRVPPARSPAEWRARKEDVAQDAARSALWDCVPPPRYGGEGSGGKANVTVPCEA